MADVEDIARRLCNIIASPDTVTGLINGGLSVPLDYGYLVYGIFDTDTRYARETQRIRMMTAIKNDILNYENIVNAVNVIFKAFNRYLTEEEQDKIYRSVTTSMAEYQPILSHQQSQSMLLKGRPSRCCFRGEK
ncbi:MAG: hypothetical protein ACLR9W_06000 [Enterobacter hormaechei]